MSVIRKASIHEVDRLLALAIKIFRETFQADNNPDDFEAYMSEAFTKEKFIEEYNEAESQFYVALEDDVLVGYARVRKNSEVDNLIGTNHLEIQRIYVDAGWQGKGIAAELLKACEQHALANHNDWIWLGVWEHNPRAHRFYQKNGYTKFSQHQFMVGNDEQTDWLMSKQLR